jgi:hypothetical protein
MTLIQLIRTLRWLKSLDDRPTRNDDGARCSAGHTEGDHHPPAQRPTSVGARKRVSWPPEPTSTRC